MKLLERTMVAGLAATRLVRAWKYEDIGQKPRKAALAWLNEPVMKRKFNKWRFHLPFGPRGNEVNVRATLAKKWVADLLDCPHCFGFWLTVVCSLLIRHRLARFLIEGLAGSMVLSTIVQWMPGFDFEQPDPPAPTEVIVHEA